MIDGLPFRVDPSMRRPRYFPANCVYEVTLRVSEGLPFAAKQVIELLLKSAMARTWGNCELVQGNFLGNSCP